MERTKDQEIAEDFLGWKPNDEHRHVYILPNGERKGLLPKFTTSEADAVSLLPILTDKGHYVSLSSVKYLDDRLEWRCWLYLDDLTGTAPTITEAIGNAIFALLESRSKPV